MDLGLSGKAAVITGAGSGLGAAMAAAFIDEGAAVLLVDRDADGVARQVERLAGRGRAAACVADVATADFGERVVSHAAAELGGIDVTVNNAAIYPSKPWSEFSIAEFDEVIATNLRSMFVLARAAVPVMAARGGGAVINIGSLTFISGMGMLLPYVTAKGGVVGFTRALSREVGADNIRVNTVSPGAFPTGAETIHPDPESYARHVLDQQALKFRGTPEHLANVVVFLASERAQFITGQTIGVDGGWVHT